MKRKKHRVTGEKKPLDLRKFNIFNVKASPPQNLRPLSDKELGAFRGTIKRGFWEIVTKATQEPGN